MALYNLVILANVTPLHPRSRPEAPQPEPADDAELVRRATAGDRRAKEVLCRRHLKSVRSLVYRLLPADTELEDIVQETFVTALDNLRKLRDDSSVEYWLRGIAINVVRHRLRKRKWLRRLGAWTPAPDQEDAIVARGAPADVVAELNAVYAVLARLPADSRLALVLARLEGMSLAEIAQHMNISVSTVSRRLATAEVEFKNELARGAST